MRKINPAYVRSAIKNVNKCPYFTLISMEIEELDWGNCRLEVEVQEKHLQPFGMVHGGVFSSLVDATSFWAVYTQIDEGMSMTTVELRINYLAPATSGTLLIANVHPQKRQLLKALDIRMPIVLPHRKVRVVTRKKLVERRKLS